MQKVKVKQVKSSIKRLKKQKLTLEALGLRGIGKEVVHDATPNILGMIKKVAHLVSVSEA
ncbi:50S ribosomal protein L30 [Flavobacteriaceae bacterium]|jgi:large subunit ribosomal protein L30|nr:50S ribosomal protein L30 [Flavobacteriaceae bacterium]